MRRIWTYTLILPALSAMLSAPLFTRAANSQEIAPAAPAETAAENPSASPSWFDQSAIPGHTIEMLPTGDDLTHARQELIEQAKESIYISTYMFIPDEAGWDIALQLCAKAALGVDVRLFADSFGSKPLKKRKYVKFLQNCGVRILFYNPPRWGLADLAFAMHEKLFIVDGTHLLIGGNGYDNKYRRAARFSKVWHDIEFKIAGPVACWYHRQFIDTWAIGVERTIQATRNEPVQQGDEVATEIPYYSPEELEKFFGLNSLKGCEYKTFGNSRIAPFYGNPLFSEDRPLLDAHIAALKASKRKVVLYAPYFVPHERFAPALIEARKRGVDVSIITNSPRSSDEKASITVGMFLTVKQLLRAGVKIYLWDQPSTMHRKGGIYDDRWTYFGSDNLDRRGQEYSSEAIAFTDDPRILSDMHDEYTRDLQLAEPLTEAYMKEYVKSTPIWTRIMARLILKYI